MIYNTETDLHMLLDGLTDGEHVKATWAHDKHTITAEGPVVYVYRIVRCYDHIRMGDGTINPALTSLEVANDEEVTVTRDDEGALHALLDSLKDGETVTAEWRNENGSMIITGTVHTFGPLLEVYGYIYSGLRLHNGVPHHLLHSVTVRRPVVKRWERDDDE